MNMNHENFRAQRWQKVQRVLVIRLDNLGDVLMTTPALAALRERLPEAHLTLLASPSGAMAAPHLPMVDTVLPFSAPWMKHNLALPGAIVTGEIEHRVINRLIETAFDAAVIFTVCTQSALPAALLCRLAGIPLRLAHSRENPYDLLTDWLPETDTVVSGAPHAQQHQMARHEVQRQLDLVAAVGFETTDDRLRFHLHAADRQHVARLLHAAGVKAPTPYVVMHPGATAESRRWPAARFGLAARAIADSGCAVVFSGAASELDLVAQALQAAQTPVGTVTKSARPAPVISMAGVLSLGDLAALIEGASVVVSNNSAPVHLAAALGTPVVDLYALTNPQHAPWRVEAHLLYADVPCRWCLRSVCPLQHHACLRGVEPHEVVDATLSLIRPRRASVGRLS
jgi:lipopolysaccharide heptosyltransferase II